MSLNALYQALLLASQVHCLTIVDNEIGIASTIVRRRYLAEQRTAKTEKAGQQHKIWQEMADEIWRTHPNWGNSRVAGEIAKRAPGGPPVNSDTIRRRIKKRN